jgi:plasmid stability protein
VATLHARGVPDDLYDELAQRARAHGVSITAEAIRLLRRALAVERAGQRDLIEAIRRERRPLAKGAPSAHQLIRRDRER